MKSAVTEQGFTLIELLLVVVIIGLSLAVIVPRAWRANVDTKYGLVRQNCSELASYGMQWAEGQLLAQTESSAAALKDYLDSLSNTTTGCWIADGSCNWSSTTPTVPQRTPPLCEANVRDIVPPEKIPRNPFNGASVFVAANDPGATPVPGAVACCCRPDTSSGTTWYYLSLIHI